MWGFYIIMSNNNFFMRRCWEFLDFWVDSGSVIQLDVSDLVYFDTVPLDK